MYPHRPTDKCEHFGDARVHSEDYMMEIVSERIIKKDRNTVPVNRKSCTKVESLGYGVNV